MYVVLFIGFLMFFFVFFVYVNLFGLISYLEIEEWVDRIVFLYEEY